MKTNLTAMLSAANSAEGMLKLLIFFVGLIMVLWGINLFRHIKSGKWTNFQKAVDIVGLLFFGVLMIMLFGAMI
ncbi:MAG: hypothetical protein IKV85_10410 [Ruminococcus sp.]|jgi:hypothetical protein|nr:hypothetical protein [Ruminococcus sp.]